MSASPPEASTAEGLRERHISQTKSSQINIANGTEPVVENGNGHAWKEKKTFGRTPDGTGELRNFPLQVGMAFCLWHSG
jgi:hypothetical protein